MFELIDVVVLKEDRQGFARRTIHLETLLVQEENDITIANSGRGNEGMT